VSPPDIILAKSCGATGIKRMAQEDEEQSPVLSVDPVAFIREVEKIWQVHDGAT